MESKPLQQAIDLVLDTESMKGPVRKREMAELVARQVSPDQWSINDLNDAQTKYIMSEISTRMTVPLSEEYIRMYMPNLSRDMWDLIITIPRFICVSPNAGPNSEWVLSYIATAEEWKNNASMKSDKASATQFHANVSKTIHDYLVHNKADSILEFTNR